MYGRHCGDCPLRNKAEPFQAKGNRDAKFMIVTDSPSHHENSYGRLLSKSAMALLGRNLSKSGFSKDDFLFCPQVRCAYDPDKYSTKEKTAIAKACRPYLVEMAERLKPKAIIPLGTEAAKQVFGRAAKITKVRGIVVESKDFGGAKVLPTLNPSMAVMYPQHEPTIRADCESLRRLVDSGYSIEESAKSLLGDYKIIDDLQFLIDAKPEVLAYDTETTGLSWFAKGATILTMQFCIKPGEAYLLPWDHPDQKKSMRAKKKLRGQLHELLNSTTVVGQNAKFDAVFTKAHAGVSYKIGGDTKMLAVLLDENSTANSQADLVRRYVPDMAGYSDRFDSTVNKSKMAEHPLDEDFLGYACGDADSLLRLYHELYGRVSKDKRLLNHYHRVSIAGLNLLKDMDMRGQYVDEAAVAEFEQVLEAEVATMKIALLEQVPASIKRAHIEKGLSFTRADFVIDILFRHKDGFRLKPKVFTETTARLEDSRRVPSVSSKNHLPFFFDECPFTRELAEYIKTERLLGTNIKGFKNKYIHDGMVRPTYRLDNTVTGRTSSEEPNGQNFPKKGIRAKQYRRIFVAPTGHYLIEADYSQAELRVAASLANETTMIGIYRNGGDIHKETGALVAGTSRQEFASLPKSTQKDYRQKAKAVNFGFLYGMWYKKFVSYAKTDYGVEFTDAEAERLQKGYFRKFPNLTKWHDKVRAFVRENKYVRSYTGRIRHLPTVDSENEWVAAEAERQGINTGVQEVASSMGIMAAARLNDEVDEQYLSVVAFVHDAIYAYVPCEYLEWGIGTLKGYMESVPFKEWFGVELKVPMVADASFGANMGDMVELPGSPASLRPEVGKYDFASVLEESSVSGIIVPPQKIPPNFGRKTRG